MLCAEFINFKLGSLAKPHSKCIQLVTLRGKQTEELTNKQAGRQADRHVGRQADSQTDRQTDRQIDRQTVI